MTKLNKAVNTRLQKNLSPEYIYGSQGLQGGFPSRQTLWSRELKVPDVRRDVASAAHVPQRQTAMLRQVQRWADCQRGGAAGFLGSSGFLSFDCICSYNPKASFGLGKLILLEQQQYGCTLRGTG